MKAQLGKAGLSLALLLVLMLMPVQNKGSGFDEIECPACGQPMTISIYDSYQHGYLCYNFNCPDNNPWHGLEDHSPDAECFCSVCKQFCHIEEAWYPDGIHIPATCTEPGYEYDSACIYCSRCKRYNNSSDDIDYIPALGHDWGEWQVTKLPQIGTAGERERTCSRCDETETESIAALIGYSITGPTDGSWTKGSTDSFSITVKRSEDDADCFSHYMETLVDGNPAAVSAKAGS